MITLPAIFMEWKYSSALTCPFKSHNSTMQQDLLPLFPLQVVLFPRTSLPLHIFEDRYKEMIGEAITANTEFGVVLAGEKGIANTGCTALVDRVIERHADGRLDLISSGRRRFEIQSLNQEKAYLRGTVEFFDDETEDADPVAGELKSKVIEAYNALSSIEERRASPSGMTHNSAFNWRIRSAIFNSGRFC